MLHGGILCPLPTWILEDLHPQRPIWIPPPSSSAFAADRAVAGLIRTIAGAREGERNTLTYWGACRFAELVKDGKLSEDAARGIIIEAAARAGLHHDEAQKAARSAFRTIGI